MRARIWPAFESSSRQTKGATTTHCYARTFDLSLSLSLSVSRGLFAVSVSAFLSHSLSLSLFPRANKQDSIDKRSGQRRRGRRLTSLIRRQPEEQVTFSPTEKNSDPPWPSSFSPSFSSLWLRLSRVRTFFEKYVRKSTLTISTGSNAELNCWLCTSSDTQVHNAGWLKRNAPPPSVVQTFTDFWCWFSMA